MIDRLALRYTLCGGIEQYQMICIVDIEKQIISMHFDLQLCHHCFFFHALKSLKIKKTGVFYKLVEIKNLVSWQITISVGLMKFSKSFCCIFVTKSEAKLHSILFFLNWCEFLNIKEKTVSQNLGQPRSLERGLTRIRGGSHVLL